jgi:hypothetical protein
LQVLCAPFVAITFYNIVLPSSLAVGATLGFASGFASEAVLIAIRAGLEPIVQYLNKTVVTSVKGSAEDDNVAAVTALLAKDKELGDSQIQVRRPTGMIELVGTVKSEELRKKAAELAKGATNITQVKNSIVIASQLFGTSDGKMSHADISDADLPPDAGRMQPGLQQHDNNEEDIDGCDVDFDVDDVTQDVELPVAVGGTLEDADQR